MSIVNNMKTLRPYQHKAIQQTLTELSKSTNPILLEASVGSGKSLMIAWIMKQLENQGKNALCLVSCAELVRNNSSEFKELGGDPAVFCASLNKKEHNKQIIFATPQSILSSLNKNHSITDRIFNLIIIDECHMVDFNNTRSSFMRILRFYKQNYPSIRVLGLTGTAYRGRESIVGDNCLFKVKTGGITTNYLISEGFLVKPIFGIKNVDSINMSDYHVEKNEKNKHDALKKIVADNKRLTWDIMQEVKQVMNSHNVAIVFCSTREHCYEAIAALPEDEARIILGDTPDKERHESLTLARNKQIRFLISVNCLLTGINVPAIDLIIWLRPTSSLLLFTQGIGRGLRLNEGKSHCTVLDYAGNLDHFQDIDDPIINEAIQPKPEEEKQYVIPCYTCNTLNHPLARRCRGMPDNKRCDHYFDFKPCYQCGIENDITARRCRNCSAELIDPNAKLSINHNKYELTVKTASYWVTTINGNPAINVKYDTLSGLAFECYTTNSMTAKNITYARFVKLHADKPSLWYKGLSNIHVLRAMIGCPAMKTPHTLVCDKDRFGRWIVRDKLFG